MFPFKPWSPVEMEVENPLKANERTLAISLCVHLNQMARAESLPYNFHSEMPEGNRSLDMVATSSASEGIFVGNHVYRGIKFFYAIEAKLLPLKGAREQEYVISHHRDAASPEKKMLGGIERFKQGIYVPNLNRCSMVAFVQDIPDTPWMAVINGWIDALVQTKPTAHCELWATSDQLTVVNSDDTIDECASSHARMSNGLTPIKMCHFFIYLAGKN